VQTDVRRWEVAVGRVAPVGGRTYIRTEDGQTVAVYGGLGAVIRGDTNTWIDGALTRASTLDRVVVTRPSGLSWTVRFEASRWTALGQTSSELLSDWVYAWRDLQVSRWIDQVPDDTSWRVEFVADSGHVERRDIYATAACWVAVFEDGRMGCVDDSVGSLLELAAVWESEGSD
jgi:hypothetical protein